jgi:hypothetical protein
MEAVMDAACRVKRELVLSEMVDMLSKTVAMLWTG